MKEKLTQIVEAALLAAGRPLLLDQLLGLFPEEERPERKDVRKILDELRSDYEGRGIELVEVSGGFRIQVRSTMAPWVSRLWESRPSRYSRAMMETLALIAYRQPVTRGEIEAIRGVSVSSNIIKTLMEREWIRVVGQRDVPGKPSLFATTREFLDYFSLKNLDDLPTLAEIRDLDTINCELDLNVPGLETDVPDAGSEASGGDASLAEAKTDEAADRESRLDETLSETSSGSDDASGGEAGEAG